MVQMIWLQIKNRGELFKTLDEYSVGEKVVLKIQRGSDSLEVPFVLEEAKG